MKSAFLVAIFGITAAGAIVLAVPAEEKTAVVYSSPAKWAKEYGAPVVPQTEEKVQVPEPLEHYSVTQSKTEKQRPRGHRHVARPRPNFFERLVAGFIKLQKHHPAKSTRTDQSHKKCVFESNLPTAEFGSGASRDFIGVFTVTSTEIRG